MRIMTFLLILSSVLMSPMRTVDVTAARFPQSVEKKVIYRGDQAREIGLLLGFDATRESERLYRLSQEHAWAVALREHPRDYDAAKAAAKDRFNRIRYLPQPEPCVIIEGNWLDNHTGAGSSPELPRYTFSSPPLSENAGDAAWSRLLTHLLPKAHKPTTDSSYWETLLGKKIYDQQNQVFSINLYLSQDKQSAADRRGYIIIIGSGDNKLK